MPRENCTRIGAVAGTLVSPSVGELKTISPGSFGGGGASSTTTRVAGACAGTIVFASSSTRPRSRLTTPLTCSQWLVSTRASTLRSNPLPFGRRPVTHTAPSVLRSTKSYLSFAGAAGTSPNRLRPPNWPVTDTDLASDLPGSSAVQPNVGADSGPAVATFVMLRSSSSPGCGQ